MGLIGREIVQTRTYIDPNNPSPPDQNYKESFPITVFDAVREDMNNENSPKLSTLLQSIQQELQGKQPLFQGKSANYLMTFAGTPGAVGAVQMSMNIPWSPNEQKHDRIPTEKAVGDLMFKLGLVDEDGNIVSPDRAKIRYSDVIGRPLIYEGLGNNTDGYIHQKGVTESLSKLDNKFIDVETWKNGLSEELRKHRENRNNPHGITLDQIGGASAESLSQHIADIDNPHHVTKYHIELGNVDNTSDMDKPVSTATQKAIDSLKNMLNIIQDDAKGFITDITYDQPSGKFTVLYHNGSSIQFMIPINGLVDEVRYNKQTKQLDIYELSGEVKHTDVSDLFIRYLGSVSSTINVSIIGNNDTGEQLIHAVVVPKGITDEELADSSVITRALADQSVTTEKIHDLTITTEKYANESITTEKVAGKAITNTRIGDRSVNGRTLFSSSIDNRVLLVGDNGTDPVYGQVNSDMIENAGVENKNMAPNSISSPNLQNSAVTTPKIQDGAVTTSKIYANAVTNQKLGNGAVDGRTIIDSVNLPGTPTIETRPDDDSSDSSIPDTRWTVDRIRSYINQNHNYGDRTVDGRALFSSDTRHRVLAVLRANSDPTWTQVDELMLADNSVVTNHIKDRSVTRAKIAASSIYSEHLTPEVVTEASIRTSAVTSSKLFTSDHSNMVLAALSDNGHPVYSKVVNDMMDPNSVSTEQIEDGSVTLSKIHSSEEPNRLIGVTLKNTHPQWVQANTQMIKDGAITLDKIHEVPFRDMVLGSQSAGVHPLWTKINGNMILDNEIVGRHIPASEITGDHIRDRNIEGKHILQYQIDTEHIAPGAIHGDQMFTSPYPNRILGVTDPFSKADWLKVTTGMVNDEAITGDKIFRSLYDNRVLATTRTGNPVEYLKITNDFIVDDTIRPQKLVKDFVLYGVPQMTGNPDPAADSYEIPNTRWVRSTVHDMLEDFKTLYGTVTNDMIKDHAVGPTKFFRSIYDGPRLLGVTEKTEDVEYLLVEEAMIADGSVTTNKLQRSIHLLGSPVIEVRPSPTANQYSGEGDLIPDVQWVLDRIEEHMGSGSTGGSGGGSSSTATPPDNSVTTVKIQNRAVTGPKLFTSGTSNRVLAVVTANSDPQYVQINENMIADNAVTPRSIFKSSTANTILATTNANDNATWTKVNHSMMANNSVGTDQIIDSAVTGNKIANKSIDREKFVDAAIIDEPQLYDSSVTNRKIADNAVNKIKIADKAVDGNKIDDNVVLSGYPTVESGTDYTRRSIRNTILSPNAPSGGKPGDIWIRYS